MANEAKHKHLEFIQGIVNRLGSNSFQAKGWTVTLVAAIFVLAADKEATGKLQLLLVAFIPIIMFWLLDAYFIWQERLFRELYKDVSKIEDEASINYAMNVGVYDEGRNTWRKSIFSKTLNIFYGTLLFLMLAILVITFFM